MFGVFFSIRFFRYVIWFTGYKAIPTTNTREVTCHGLILENEALNFCLREEDMVTKWWAILKNTVTYRKASCFSLLFLLKIHTSVFATVSPWIAIKRSMVRNDNSLQSLSLLKHQEFLFAFIPQENTPVSWGIKRREEDEYRGGEVSNRKAEKVVPFKNVLK